MQTTENLDATMTVNQVIQASPETLPIFKGLGIDTCCGGALTLEAAAARQGMTLQALFDALREPANLPA
jgi:regulator of cell morphogenesis and NO signaling